MRYSIMDMNKDNDVGRLGWLIGLPFATQSEARKRRRSVAMLYLLAMLCEMAIAWHYWSALVSRYALKDEKWAQDFAWMTMGIAAILWVVACFVLLFFIAVFCFFALMSFVAALVFYFDQLHRFRWPLAIVSIIALPASTLIGLYALQVEARSLRPN